MSEHQIRFAPRQKLPPGYSVIWSEQDEMYRWKISDDVYSEETCCRWMCWRGAWAHYRKSAP